MKNITKKLYLLPLLGGVALLSSCNLFGLDFQKNSEFEDADINQYVDMTAWEYIKSRSDVFSLTQEAIEYAGMESIYQNETRTFLLVDNDGYGKESGTPYFRNNRIPNPAYNPDNVATYGPETIIPSSFTAYPVETVQELFSYHILVDAISITEATDTKEWYKSIAYEKMGDTTLVAIEWTRDRYVDFLFNDFADHRDGTGGLEPSTSNIKCKNGVIHVFSTYLEAPTRDILDSYDVKY